MDPTPPGSVGPDDRSRLRQCERYRKDGTRCRNTTAYTDGWCRQDGCPGYMRDRPHVAPKTAGAPHGTAKHLRASEPWTPEIGLDEVETVRVTTRAIDSFRFHHGGSAHSARVQLLTMLEDFLLRSARRERNDYVVLAREGYDLVLTRDLATITGYSTIHRERTWAQVKAGVPSRFGKTGRAASGELPDRQASLPPEKVAEAVDTANVTLTSRTRNSYARLFDLRAASDEDLDERIRGELRAISTGQLNRGYQGGGVVEIVSGRLRWLIRDDALLVIAVGLRRPAAE